MLVKNLKISEIFILKKNKRTINNATMESEFSGFAVVKAKNGIMVSNVLDTGVDYQTIEAPMDKIGTKYAPKELHEPLSKYTTKKVITKKGIQKILEQKKHGLM